jgi:uncharacterized membrane protein
VIERATVFNTIVVLYGLFVIGMLVHGLYQLHVESGNSFPHNLGRASGYLSLLFRDPLRGIVVIIALVITLLVFSAIDTYDPDSGSNENRPPIAPIQAADLRMPTTYPFERDRNVTWPPFIGHRIPLGCDHP